MLTTIASDNAVHISTIILEAACYMTLGVALWLTIKLFFLGLFGNGSFSDRLLKVVSSIVIGGALVLIGLVLISLG